MKLAWLMEAYMSLVQKPEKILMGPQAYRAYLELLFKDYGPDISKHSHNFMNIPVVHDPTIITNHVIFIAKTLTWTPD